MILWLTPNRRNYVKHPGPFSSLWMLDPATFHALTTVAMEILERAAKPSLKDRALIALRVPHVRHLLQRLEYIPTTLRRMQLGVSELQRFLLELIGAADWYEVFEPRRKVARSTWDKDPARTLGAFTNDLQVCDQLFRMGLPVYLIRPWDALPSIRIQNAINTTNHKDLYPEEAARNPTHRAIFHGAASDVRKYISIYNHSGSYFRYADPFGSVCAPVAALAPPAVVTRAEQALKRETKRQTYSPCTFQFDYSSKNRADSILTVARSKNVKRPAQLPGGRNKFQDPVNPIYPPPIPSWSLALLNVQQDPTRFKLNTSNETDTGYAFPEPAAFIALESDARRRSFFRTWLRLRALLIFRMSSEDFDEAKPMKAQAWRELLGLNFLNNRLPDLPSTSAPSSSSRSTKCGQSSQSNNSNPGASSTSGQSRSQRLRDMMAKFLAGCLDAADNDLGDESESNSVSWNGIDFDALGDHHFEEVLWELAELNFRFELAALDGRMSGSMVSDRNPLVVTCFPDAAETGSLLIVKLECADQGLGSSNWQQKSRYLLALKRLMMGWTACTLPEIIKEEKIVWKASELDILEESITKLYSQEFYDRFRRAPIVPRRLSHAARTIAPLRHADEARVLDPWPLHYYDLSMFSVRK
jgi:hypothetical protein